MNIKTTSLTPARRSSISGFQSLYGIGKLKATKLNSFLLYHPIQSKLTINFRRVFLIAKHRDLFKKISFDKKVRVAVQKHVRKKVLTYCYQAYRLFQNLPTKGQRTKANAKSISNHNPYKSLRINVSFYRSMEVAYKKRELANNERHDELNAYTQAQIKKEKMKEEDQKQKSRTTRQEFIRKQKVKK